MAMPVVSRPEISSVLGYQCLPVDPPPHEDHPAGRFRSQSPSEGKLLPAVLLAWTQCPHLDLATEGGLEWEEEEEIREGVSWRRKGVTQTLASAVPLFFLLHPSPLHSPPNPGPIPLRHSVHHSHFSCRPPSPLSAEALSRLLSKQLPQLGSLRTRYSVRDRSLSPVHHSQVHGSFSHSPNENLLLYFGVPPAPSGCQ